VDGATSAAGPSNQSSTSRRRYAPMVAATQTRSMAA